MHNLNPQLQPQPQPFYARARITLACLPLRLVGEGEFFFAGEVARFLEMFARDLDS